MISGHPIHVLLVDDDDTLRCKLASKLQEHGFVVHTLENAFLACSYLHEASVKPDLIIMDLNMPEMTGVEFCSYKAEQPCIQNIPLILMTANHAFAEEFCQGQTVLHKPFACSTLLETISDKITAADSPPHPQHPNQNPL
jgi:CheY-like chemotaxis protein